MRYDPPAEEGGIRRSHTIEALEARLLLARFAVIGDYSSNEQLEPTRDVAARVKSWDPDFIATVGDNNYPLGEAATIDSNIGQYYHDYISPYTGAYGPGSPGGNRFWPALGNHDWNPNGAAYTPYTDYFTLPGNERYYTTVQGNTQLFVLNSDEHEPDGTSPLSIQGLWLQSQLAASTAQWKLVLFHHPPFSSGANHGDNPFMDWPFQQWGATAVITGHDHDYERFMRNGIPYFVNGLGGESQYSFRTTPSAGSVVRYVQDYGAMLIDATAAAINFKFITRSGALVDTYTINSSPQNYLTVIPMGSTWKYLDNGSNQGSAWRNVNFSDATWASGPAQLGYGDGGEATVISYGGNASNKFITT